MTTRHAAQPSAAPPPAHYPERPNREDMENQLHREQPGHATALIRHYASPGDTLVIGDLPVGWNLSNQRGILYPDLMVAFNVDVTLVFRERGFSVGEHGKPPDFVLEIASPSTAHRDYNDYRGKRRQYAEFGIPEYWRYDSSGGGYYPAALAGDRLGDGVYQPMEIHGTREEGYWGRSEVLNLYLCWEGGELRFWDPVSQRYLRTHDEEAEARIAAESQLNAERLSRIDAEADYQARIRQLEEELHRRDG